MKSPEHGKGKAKRVLEGIHEFFETYRRGIELLTRDRNKNDMTSIIEMGKNIGDLLHGRKRRERGRRKRK